MRQAYSDESTQRRAEVRMVAAITRLLQLGGGHCVLTFPRPVCSILTRSPIRYRALRHEVPSFPPLTLCAALFSVLLLFAACDTGADRPASIDDVPPERLMAFTAVYAETLPSGAPIQRIVVADRLNPQVFEVISDESGVSVQPIMSPDKRYVLFGDDLRGTASESQLVLYDLYTQRADTLMHLWPNGTVGNPLVAPMYPIVWERDSRGFYYTNPAQPFSIKQDVLRYRLDRRVFERIRDAGEYGTMAIGFKDADTLVVISSEPSVPGYTEEHPVAITLMTKDGELHRRVRNPDLAYVREAGAWKQQFLNPTWDSKHQIIVTSWFSLDRVQSPPQRAPVYVLVSKLDQATSQVFELDDTNTYLSPYWIEDVGIVVEAAPYGQTDWRTHRLLVINPETGAVRPFADPALYGAVGLRICPTRATELLLIQPQNAYDKYRNALYAIRLQTGLRSESPA